MIAGYCVLEMSEALREFFVAKKRGMGTSRTYPLRVNIHGLVTIKAFQFKISKTSSLKVKGNFEKKKDSYPLG